MVFRCNIIFLLVSLSLFSHAQVQFVVFAGPQVTSVNYKVNTVKQPAQFKAGAMTGIALKVPFENQLYFFPSIYYSLKGYKVDLKNPSFPPSIYAKNNNTTIHTIEISPLFHIDFNKKPSHPFVRFGPAIDIAFAGREKFDSVSTTGVAVAVNRKMVFSFGDYGRIAASANIHLGYESKSGFMIFGFYEHGIGSINNADGGPKILHRISGVSIGWMFGQNPLIRK
jgi:hypothetical protein